MTKVTRLQTALFERYGSEQADTPTDLTPEAAFIAVAVANSQLSVTSYGDCSLLVVNDGRIRFQLPKEATWLGAFSHAGLGNRKAVNEALIFKKVPLLPDDYIALFTDGLDEWEHDEKSSVQPEEIAALFDGSPAANVVKSLGYLAFSHNAQDDVSVLVHKA
ncbi:MAG TPA: SpoIIE family protein phosphatase [Verrucomicrobiae bacterium]|nr:SpoIIE family protein phosphatase [Verrucomicrobiae bacterium]